MEETSNDLLYKVTCRTWRWARMSVDLRGLVLLSSIQDQIEVHEYWKLNFLGNVGKVLRPSCLLISFSLFRFGPTSLCAVPCGLLPSTLPHYEHLLYKYPSQSPILFRFLALMLNLYNGISIFLRFQGPWFNCVVSDATVLKITIDQSHLFLEI